VPDEQWLHEIYLAHYKRLYAIGRLFVGRKPLYTQVVEDMVQEAFLILWSKRDKLYTHPNIGGWLVETMRSLMLNYLRKQKRRNAHLAFSLDEEGAEPRVKSAEFELPEDALTQKENLETLKTLLGDENAALFYSYCVENKSAGEIAKAFGLSEGCVRMRAMRLRKTILENKDLFMAVIAIFLVTK
jgi:RNA polymerase sigma-70 factor (ECF subfamily)